MCEDVILTKKKAVAVHCKAGLGRTGSLIGAFVIKHFGFPASAFIGWIRICRPGSVLGPQQKYLNYIQEKLFAEGEQYRKKNDIDLKQLKISDYSIYEKETTFSAEEKKIFDLGEKNQGDSLVRNRRNK